MTHTYQDPENNVWRVKVLRDSDVPSFKRCEREDGEIVTVHRSTLKPINPKIVDAQPMEQS